MSGFLVPFFAVMGMVFPQVFFSELILFLNSTFLALNAKQAKTWWRFLIFFKIVFVLVRNFQVIKLIEMFFFIYLKPLQINQEKLEKCLRIENRQNDQDMLQFI